MAEENITKRELILEIRALKAELALQVQENIVMRRDHEIETFKLIN